MKWQRCVQYNRINESPLVIILIKLNFIDIKNGYQWEEPCIYTNLKLVKNYLISRRLSTVDRAYKSYNAANFLEKL